jgi:rhamnulokinase
MSKHQYLAFDLGAESGRAVLGTLDNGLVSIREIHRFPNAPIAINGLLHWDAPSIFNEIKKGLKICATQYAPDIESVAVDTWGVDFGLLAEDGTLLGLPFAYRDLRNVRAMEKFLARFPKERIYEITGVQFLPFNSLFQLFALTLENPELLASAADLLFMPDLFTFFLSGRKATETTIASTSQLFDSRRGEWSEELFDALGLSRKIVRKPTPPGTVIGRLLPAVARESGLKEIPVVATAGHDTACAVAAVPARGKQWAYISSGTWSLIGIETPAPLITPETMRLNFTNEGGLENRTRLLKNVTGLWLVQECRKRWSADRPLSYEDMRDMAEKAEPFKAMIDPDAQDLLNPPDMPDAVQELCRRSGQSVPETKEEILRCIIESLALKYRMVLEELKRISPHSIGMLHVIGGGSRHATLCRFTANAASLPVAAGPVEATAIGNIMGQALALGHVRSLEEIRAIVSASTEITSYEPQVTRAWDAAYMRFQKIMAYGRS